MRPRFPTPQGQTLDTWIEAYDRAVASLIAAPTIPVGHTLGAAMALRLLETAPIPLAGLFLAAGFVGALGLPNYDPINASFIVNPFDWAAIRQRKGSGCRCWAGDSGPHVPLPRSRELAGHLEAPLDVVPGGGHLNDETGFNTFPHMRDAILAAREHGRT